ncbi:fasciclin domain-containing protein [Flavobacterium sp. LB1P71]|uniref:fasciclin domain-containing protein n=1 Tax=unclassified Flavobacterium TaxID=196869 RepID=UPI003AAC7805
MIVLNLNYKRLLVSLLTIALVSCSNPWDDRENNDDANLGVNLSEAITNTTEVSLFGALLVQTGYDKILSESKTYTVFAPTNEAIYQLDKSILNDAKGLKQFVANHIALTAYSSIRSGEKTQIKMFSDKYLTFKGSTMIDDATIVTADHYAANGVFHIINKALTPKLNIWQYINSKAGLSATSDYLLFLKSFSIYKADSDAKASSAPGYLADSLSNSYLRNVYNLNNEKNSYTVFLMQDAGYNAEVDKMKPYLIKTSNNPAIDSTAIYSKYFTLRDMAFPKKYELNELPATLTSRFGVEVPIDKTQIVGEPIQLSNGVVYIMKKVDVRLDKRLVTTKIEGEKNNVGFINGPRSAIYYRDKKNPLDPLGVLYNDVIVQNPGTASFMLDYDTKDLYSTTYKVYWRAINDFQTTVVLQSLRFAGKYVTTSTGRTVSDVITTLGPISVQPNFYEPVYIGEFTLTKARNIDLISLIAANTTTNGNNSLTLDYLKFVPVLK